MRKNRLLAAVGISALFVAGGAATAQTASAASLSAPGCTGSALCEWYNSNYGGGAISFFDPGSNGGKYCIPSYSGYSFSDGNPVANNQASVQNHSSHYTAFLFINHLPTSCDPTDVYQPHAPLEVDPGVKITQLDPIYYKNNLMANTWY
ncbi:hypothetical protein ACIQGZ_17945 [Streptomyces sp. NPDC092296]|uniref:hypothetical protein n=1 Tax=Streptomyces sp. NPDC092296 TaxID=3366012 RepID=UPI003827113E